MGDSSTIAPCAGDRSTAWEPQLPSLPALELDALLDDGVEDGADDVERAVHGRSRVEHEEAHAVVGVDLERRVLVLVGDAVEHDVVGRGRGRHRLGQVRDLALRTQVPLALDERELRVDGRQALGGLHDDHPEHAVRDVVERGRRAAVVHPDAGVVGRPLVHQLLAGRDGAHLVVPGHLARVEVDGVRHRVARQGS